MANEVTLFADDDLQLPDYVQSMFGGEVANDELSSGVNSGYPVISYRGKVWAINEGGVRTMLSRPGEKDVPAPYIDVVIVKANPALSKVFYAGGYEEGSNERPTCYSHDGRAPAADAPEPQAKACLACPHNAWGSRITDNGSKGKACSDSRRLAIVPVGELDRLMLLRVPAGSLKDLAAYAGMLKRRRAPYQAVVTRIGFDHEAAHPQMTFKAIRWLPKAEALEVAELLHKDLVLQITGTTEGAHPAPEAEHADSPATVAAADVDQALAKPSTSPRGKPNLALVSDVEEAFEAPARSAPARASKPRASAKAAPKAETKAVEKVEPATAQKAPSSNSISTLLEEADSELDELLAGHFDD